jgi:hypothetical protein
MSVYWIMLVAVILAQVGCVLDMCLRGETLRMPVAGGALAQMRRNDSRVGFYAMISIWIFLFVGIDMMVFSLTF